jgi:acetyl esterase/lipase
VNQIKNAMKNKLYRMLLILSSVAILSHNMVSAQTAAYCAPNSCLFWSPQPEGIDSAVVTYAQNVWSIDEWDNAFGCGFFNQCENLNMLVYSPKLQPGEKRPLVVLIHGGGFISGDYTAFQATARTLAQMGYVTATINYRLCKRNNCLIIGNTGCTNLCNANFISDFVTGAYVAALDANNAIRFLQLHADQYHIDADNIIVGGHSAGAWTAMHVAYLDQSEANAINPQWEGVWGPLNPVTGIKGVLCLSGAVIDTNIIDADKKYPVFVLHGTCDPTICYDIDAPFHCNNSYPKVFGGSRIADRLKNLGHPFYLFSGLGMGHDIGPLSDIWADEAFRFMRSAMLCGDYMQKHSTATLSPGSAECTLLQFDIPSCNLQQNHPQLSPNTLAVSAAWGGFPAPCGNGLVGTVEVANNALISVKPTLVSDILSLEASTETATIQVNILNAQGQMIHSLQLYPGAPQQIEMANFPAGLYVLQCRTATGKVQTERIIKK